MKLKTTLIPVSCLGLCGSIITPLTLTSCGNGSAIGRSFDLVKNYYPTIERHEHAVLPLHEINEDYAKTIVENPEVFVQDYLWGKCWSGFAFEQFLFWQELIPGIRPLPSRNKYIIGSPKLIYTSDIEVINNLSIVDKKVVWDDVEWSVPLLSFTISFESKIKDIVFQDYYFEGLTYTGTINGFVSGKVEFLNVPFYIIPRTVTSEESGISLEVLSFEPFFEWMVGTESGIEEKVQPWQIITSTYSSISGQVSYDFGITQRIADDWRLNVTSNQDTTPWKYDMLTLEETIGRVFSTSYYLEQVQLDRRS